MINTMVIYIYFNNDDLLYKSIFRIIDRLSISLQDFSASVFENDCFNVSIIFLSESVMVCELDLVLYMYETYITYLLRTHYIVPDQALFAFEQQSGVCC